MRRPAEEPAEIGRYRILSVLGRGSMGRVYLAEDPNIERKVALKVLFTEGLDPETERDFRQRFVIEARAAGKLNHPGIVTIYDAGADPESGWLFIAMEWVDGESLHQILRRRGLLPVTTAIHFVTQVARALDYAHREGVVHRDVKPANVLVRPDGQIKVTDFGIAKLGAQSMTLAGTILGTPAFMSPEQVSSRSVDRRSDLFSLGTVLHLCLTGRNPFEAETFPAISHKIVQEEVAPVDAEDPTIPEALSKVLERALRKQPEERFQTGAAFAEALDEVRRGLGEQAGGGEDPLDLTAVALDDLKEFEGLPPIDAPILTGERPAPSSKLRLVAVTVLIGVVALGLWLTAGLRRDSPPQTPAPDAGPAENGSESAGGPETSNPPLPVVPPAEPRPVAPPPPPEPPPPQPPPPEPAPIPNASVELFYINRMRQGEISVRIDGKPYLSQQLESKNAFRRLTKGERFTAVLPFHPGRHSIEVRIRRDDAEASKSVRVSLRPREKRKLQVSVTRRKPLEIELDWAD